MTKRYVIAADIGTTSAKALAVTREGKVAAVHSEAYPLLTPQPGYAEQDPEAIFAAVKRSIAAVVQAAGIAPDDAACVAFSSAMHSLIGMDGEGRPLTASITWADQRAAAQAERLTRDGSGLDVYLRTGTPIHPMSPLVKLIWMRERMPELAGRVRMWVGIKEYVLSRLFGQYVTDYSIASATGMFNLRALAWDAGALALAGVTAERLPRLVPTTHRLAGLSAADAAELGLGADTPFVVGASDGVLANLGAGAIEEGVVAVTIGTSSAVRAAADRPSFDEAGRLFCYALTDDRWIVGGPSNNGAIVAQWMAERLYPGRPMEEAMARAGEAPAGAGGLLFLPLLTGERAPHWNADARGVLFGLTLGHTDRDMMRAALEGVLFQVRAIYDLLASATAGTPRLVRASGGFARSELWCAMMADMLGVPVEIPEQVESSGLGAAQLGLYAVEGGAEPLLRWREWRGKAYEPDDGRRRVYERLLPIYRDVYERTQGQMEQLAALQQADGQRL